MKTRIFFFLIICSLVGMVISKPAKAGMKFNLSSELDDTTGNIQVQSGYNRNVAQPGARYSLEVRGIDGAGIVMNNSLYTTSTSIIETNTTAIFEGQSGRSILGVKEKAAVQGANDKCFAGAMGAGIEVSRIELFDSKGSINTTVPKVGYILTAEEGSGRLAVGVEGVYLERGKTPESVTYHYGVDGDFGHFYGKYELSSE